MLHVFLYRRYRLHLHQHVSSHLSIGTAPRDDVGQVVGMIDRTAASHAVVDASVPRHSLDHLGLVQ